MLLTFGTNPIPNFATLPNILRIKFSIILALNFFLVAEIDRR